MTDTTNTSGEVDAVTATFLEARQQIDAVRAMYPDRSDKAIALALLRKSEASIGREAMLLGLVATVLHYAANYGSEGDEVT